MINSLTIHNFQSHKNTDLDFHKGVNAIIGQSDCGKTAILRALKWVVSNKPSGEAFRSKWGGDTEVRIHIDKHDQVIRQKDTENKYRIERVNKGDITLLDFKSFGQDVPEDIKKLLNISPINFQTQHAAPFLLSNSSGEVARYLNKIVQLDKIDIANTNINSTLRKEKQDLQYETGRLTELDEKLKGYVWLGTAEGCLVKLEQFEASLIEKKLDRRELVQLRDSIIETEETIEEIDEIVQHEDEVNRLIELQEKIDAKKERFDDLTALYNNIVDTKERISDLNTKIDVGQKEFERLMPQVCPLCGRGGENENCKHR